ncbi:sugar kinase [Thermasporomyces composti]|jgi:2-dehydro-3-deoxygluconokinase|uniref:2-dehydro-3-deoxygluconokinase n=1 Tax=Thermasporomyces composti TaxID=696763 RepID=A0A3D9V393_THECX|nr:sugar kinase [Thermasporomyces composti]REF35959.1 2-dehydro-3-deoxygluconokinase [Thermasporomyces composti]
MSGDASPDDRTNDQGGTRVDLVTLGETMGLVAATDTGSFTVGAPARVSFGGAETNVAIGVSRLGHRAAWIGRLGDDPLGLLIASALRGEGVDVSRVTFETEVPTGLMLRERRTADRVRVSYYRRGLAGSRLAPDDVDPELVRAARLLHVSGITPALSPSARAAVHRAVEIARDAGVLVSFDLNYRAALWSPAEAGAELATLVERADLVFAGEDEAALVVGEGSVAHLAKGLASRGPTQVVIKRGGDGAYALIDGEVVTSPALPVTLVDPVGAGDAFVAGYLSALLDGLSPADRLRRGNVCGAFSVSVSGDWEGLPRRRELATLDSAENVAR